MFCLYSRPSASDLSLAAPMPSTKDSNSKSKPLPSTSLDGQSARSIASLQSCPAEILREILIYALALPKLGLHKPQGIVICSGKRSTPQHPLLLVNRALRQVGREVELEQNRITFIANYSENLSWLNAQPEQLLQRIRQVDLMISPTQFLYAKSLNGWNELVEALGRKLPLENVHLSINGGLDHLPISRSNRSFLKTRYETIIAPFRAGPFKECKDFFVYWPQWESLESSAEVQVKGEAYDAKERGKIGWLYRGRRSPLANLDDEDEVSAETGPVPYWNPEEYRRFWDSGRVAHSELEELALI